MTTLRSAHLTDDQFAECVMAAPSPESESHLADCVYCRQELNTFAIAVGDFNRAALGWSEAQPAVSLRGAAAAQGRSAIFAPARWALAAALLVAAGVPLAWHHDHPAPAVTEASLLTAPDDSEDQIAQDNQLMQSVNVAIGVNEPSPFREYGLQEGPPASSGQARQ